MVAEGSPPPSRILSAPGGDAATTRPADSAGAYLQSLRLARGASLDDIARATRVGRRHLEALEADDAAELPAPVFVKGFIRAYCEFLQERPDEALERYRRHAHTHSPAPRSFGGVRRAPSRLGSPIAVSLLLLAVLTGALIAVNLGLRSGGPQTASSLVKGPTPPSAPAPPAATPASPPVATPSSAPAPPATSSAPAAAPAAARAAEPAAPPAPATPSAAATPSPAPGPAAATAAPARGRQRLVVRAVEATWVRVQMDRSSAVEELLPEGAVREWSAEQDFVLTVGNAGGVELTLNGQRLPPLGSRGAVIRELVLPSHRTAPRS